MFSIEIITFLAVAVVIAALSKQFNISSVLCYLVAGALMGPNCVGIISNSEFVEAAAHFGVISLLFTIGLQLPLEKFKALKTYAFGLGSLQVVISAIAYGCILFFWKNSSLYEALLFGFSVSLSSTAVAVQILNDQGDLAAQYGKASFAVLLFQDLAVVLALALLPLAQHGGTINLTNSVIAVVKALVVLALLLSVGSQALKPVYKWASRLGSETFMAMTIMIVLGAASATLSIGLSMELGAFLTGMLLAGTEYRHQIEADIRPFKGLLLGLFFTTVGMSIDFMVLYNHFYSVTKTLGSIIAVKFSILFILCRLFGLIRSSSIRAAALLCAGGEFAFVLILPAVKTGIVGLEQQQIICLAISISMALTPLFSMIARIIGDAVDKRDAKTSVQSVLSGDDKLENHVIIAGFGTSGQAIATAIAQHLIQFVAIDFNMARVSSARARGLPVFFGDARRSEVFNLLCVKEARLVVVTLDSYTASSRTALMLLRNFPKLQVWVRAYGSDLVKTLRQAGVNVITPEVLEPSLQLAEAVLLASGVSTEEAKQTIYDYRQKSGVKDTVSSKDEVLDSKPISLT
ncbi:MAG: cation:proton antiporter [Holosporales bacterium]|nr:cation:proton antiporter [Holosporales bacterium]